MAERFASVSEEKLKFLIENKDSKNTRRTTKTSVKILNDYLREKNLEEPQDKKTPLACVLKKLYAEARKIDGSSYSKRSMTSLRFRINRHFKTKGTDIIKDSEFVEARCVDLKRQGLAKVEHKPAILENDLQKPESCTNAMFSN